MQLSIVTAHKVHLPNLIPRMESHLCIAMRLIWHELHGEVNHFRATCSIGIETNEILMESVEASMSKLLRHLLSGIIQL